MSANKKIFSKEDKFAFSIELQDDGQAVLVQKVKPVRLVISGGGGKATLYPGFVQALEDLNLLDDIQEIGASSAGAIVGAFLATGMKTEGLKEVVGKLDFIAHLKRRESNNLADLMAPREKSPGWFPWGRLSIFTKIGTSAPNLKNLIDRETSRAALGRIEEAQANRTEAGDNGKITEIRKKLHAYQRWDELKRSALLPASAEHKEFQALERQRRLREEIGEELRELSVLEHQLTRNCAVDAKLLKKLTRLKDIKPDVTLNEVCDRRESLKRARDEKANIGGLTFGDLRTLSESVPGTKKFYCTATALIDGNVPQPAVFSTENEDSLDMDLSTAVCISSALPVVFKKFEVPLAHDIDLGDEKRKTRYIDGGLSLKTPLLELIDPDVPEVENLIIAFEHRLLTAAQIGGEEGERLRRKSPLEKVLAVSNNHRLYRANFKYLVQQLAGEKFAAQTLPVGLKYTDQNTGKAFDYAGSKGTLALSGEDKKRFIELQKKLEDDTKRHLDQRRVEKVFPSLNRLLYELSDELFATVSLHSVAETDAWLKEALREVAPERESPNRGKDDNVREFKDNLREFSETIRNWSGDKTRAQMALEITKWMKAADKTIGAKEGGYEAAAKILTDSSEFPVQRMLDIVRNPSPSDEPSVLLNECRRRDKEKRGKKIAQRIIQDFYPVKDRLRQTADNIQVIDAMENSLKMPGITWDGIEPELEKAAARYEKAASPVATSLLNRLKNLRPVPEQLRSYKRGTTGNESGNETIKSPTQKGQKNRSQSR